MFKKLCLALAIGSLFLGCATSPDKSDLKVNFEEFQKILQPRSMVLLQGENAMLMVMAMKGDKYPKVYRYDFKSQKFSEVYDHGQGVGFLTESRDGQFIFLHIDNKGDENYKIHSFDPKTRKTKLVFGKDGRRAFVVNTDEADNSLFIASNYENQAVYSIYKMNLKTQKMTRISDGKTNLAGGYVAPSGQQVVAIRAQSNNQNELYLIDVAKRESRKLFSKKNSTFYPSFIDSTGKNLIGVTDYKRDRKGCARIPLNKPNFVYYIKEDKKKDISCSYGESSKLYYLSESYNGRSELTFYRKMFSGKLQVPSLFDNQTVQPISYDKKSGQMVLKYQAANSPGTLVNWNPQSKKHEQVLDFNQSSIPRSDLASSWDFNYKSFDELPIHGIIYAKKEWKKSGKKYPLVVWPHGGPDSAEGHRYRKWFQYLALNDFVVFAPNFRGSTGYGKKFETLNDKDWGGGHIKDLVEGRKAVEKLPYIDEDNVFIYGGSFGGYSTLATVTFQPDAFDAAVGFIAIGNLFTFMKSIPPDEGWQTEFIREVGHPEKDKDLYRERSPFFHVNKIKIPLAIFQAENDIRTVKPEMDDFVAEMRRQGKPVEYTVLKDVGHSLARPEAQKQVVEGTVRFFRAHMKNRANKVQ